MTGVQEDPAVTPEPTYQHDPGDRDDCRECKAQERLLSADQSAEWVADRWSRSTPHPEARTALEVRPHDNPE